MQGPHRVYLADPVWSWYWGGASPAVEASPTRFGLRLPIHLVLGGLRPWTKEPMTAQEQCDVCSHWEHLHEASGEPFEVAFFGRGRCIDDTEPPSWAAVVLRRIQRAFYAENQGVTPSFERSSPVDLGERYARRLHGRADNWHPWFSNPERGQRQG